MIYDISKQELEKHQLFGTRTGRQRAVSLWSEARSLYGLLRKRVANYLYTVMTGQYSNEFIKNTVVNKQ